MATPNSQPPKGSRLFEQLNLERLKKSSQIISHAESAIAQAKRQIEQSDKLIKQAVGGSTPASHSEMVFLRTELQTGLTLSKIALEAADQDKIERNRANARKAYDSLMHFMPKATLKAEEADEIRIGLARLKSELQQLGEEL